MDIKSIRLQNFKGFKDATLELKPLTVLVGPNSAGKSCFGQALVALSKSNARRGIPSLKFDATSSVEFGNYTELVHNGNCDQPVIVELGLTSGKITLAFGQGNRRAGINELDLYSLHYDIPVDYDSAQPSIPILIDSAKMVANEVRRNTASDWTVNDATNHEQSYKLDFNGVLINTASELTGTVVPTNQALPGFELLSNHLASLLRNISYLRPDRHKPERARVVNPSDDAFIDDWGSGTDWYIYKNRECKVQTFFFPLPAADKEEAKKKLSEYKNTEALTISLLPALTRWLENLGLASAIESKFFDGERAVQVVVTPRGQQNAHPLTDVGFGLSQVLPILVRGLCLGVNGLLVVEQPEAQLHPTPQAILADFFCSMVQCTRNVLVETHSVEFLHRLRLRASMDDELASKIGVYFFHEPERGVCSQPVAISLSEESELRWPKGFLPEGIQKEMEILSARLARKSEKS